MSRIVDPSQAETIDDEPLSRAKTLLDPSGEGSSGPSTNVPTRRAVLPRTTASSGEDARVTVPVERTRYERRRLLGRGGMGEVTLALDHDIERPVAIKRLRPEARSPTNLLRFAEEVRAIGRLEHPGIVPAYDVGVDEEGQHFLVMKYVEGETLETVIEKLRARSPAHLARFTHNYRVSIFAAVLEAVGYAHDRGLVHRDLKPANIMVGIHGEVTVMDWGIAKLAERQNAEPLHTTPSSQRILETRTGAIIGTPMYMSPEQASGTGTVDPRSDVFSLALVFWELMSLEHPLSEKRSVEEVIAALQEPITNGWIGLSRIRSGAPCEWGWFAARGLRRDPTERHASASVMLADLRRVQHGKIPVQCNVTLWKRVMHELDFWVDRHGFVFHLLTLVALSGLLACVARVFLALLRPH